MSSPSPRPHNMARAVDTRYPRGAFFILAGYLLERLVYYGLFGGSVFYMQRVMGFSASQSSSIKSIVEGLIYLAPIVGAVVADSFFGKFRLVLCMCCGYVVGTFIYSLSAATPLMTSLVATQATGISGLLVFGLCAGLMKAVYSSLGPDQFVLPEQRNLQKRFFYFFYWMINAGAFCGQLLTAQLRDSVQCFGADCFLLPYGILVGLMVLSTIVFYAGKHHYREAPADPMLIRAIKCVTRAVKLRFKQDTKEKTVDHWVDRATLPGEGQVTDAALITDVKKTLEVLLLFLTYPLFWALFYQTSTGMIFQAKRLNERIGSYRIPAELTSSINPLLILILIPLFDLVLYPLLDRFKLLTTSTSRMTTGMLFAVAAFIIYGILNMQVEQVLLGGGEASVQIYNTRTCEVTVRPWADQDATWIIPPGGQVTETLSASDGTNLTSLTPGVSEACGTDRGQLQQVTLKLKEGYRTNLIVDEYSLRALLPTQHFIKDKDAEAKVRITSLSNTHLTTNNTFILNYRRMNESFIVSHGVSEFKRIAPQPYKVFNAETNEYLGDVDIRQDGVYDIVVSPATNISLFAMTRPANVHVLWSIPQYLVMTIGEVLFSVSGMDFAYTEAPKAMKSVMQAANLFTITIGLWVFAILTSISSSTGIFDNRPSREAFTYSALMLIDTMVFFVLVRRYYNRIQQEQTAQNERRYSIEKTTEGTANPAYEEDRF